MYTSRVVQLRKAQSLSLDQISTNDVAPVAFLSKCMSLFSRADHTNKPSLALRSLSTLLTVPIDVEEILKCRLGYEKYDGLPYKLEIAVGISHLVVGESRGIITCTLLSLIEFVISFISFNVMSTSLALRATKADV